MWHDESEPAVLVHLEKAYRKEAARPRNGVLDHIIDGNLANWAKILRRHGRAVPKV